MHLISLMKCFEQTKLFPIAFQRVFDIAPEISSICRIMKTRTKPLGKTCFFLNISCFGFKFPSLIILYLSSNLLGSGKKRGRWLSVTSKKTKIKMQNYFDQVITVTLMYL